MSAAAQLAGRRQFGVWRLLSAFVERAARLVGANREALNERLREQDPEAWRQVFQSEHQAIYRYAASRVGAGPEAEDLTSQVFAEAWEHAGSFDEHGLPLRAWLFGIARNLVNSHRRQLVRRPPALVLEGFDSASADPALEAERLDLIRAVGQLDSAWADVVVLRFVHGLSVQETAGALGLTVEAVKGRQARALARLRETLSEQ